ncbi:hypothetical protein M9980_04640 [Sphingomonas donggukensis]|uniref:DUF2877 domain-containing protein n=1 Tax=Sphingomonas donggukensis TaxID=2949093 RepID=A0ABY4TVT9_9SPHN|nr:DUF6628 family protein [Sphingomonas donggukensis]URW76508.1 hypothetical protein M9980_04640 [Sphingomonas donggukensis]
MPPSCPGCSPTTLLFACRQMGAHGLEDASAAHAFLIALGKDFRRPLVLLRTLMMELSAAATRPIRIAPWCCCRMTGSEAALIDVLGRSLSNEHAAHLLLADMLGVRHAGGPLATATALAIAIADQGMPIGG